MRRPSLLPWVLAAALAVPAGAWAQAKQERDAASPSAQLAPVGQGEHLGRQPLDTGAYVSRRSREAVRAWVAQNHGPGQPCLPGLRRSGEQCVVPGRPPRWEIGKALPRRAAAKRVPGALLAALPPAPPGNKYVLVGGDVVLMAAASRMVVDAVPTH